MSPIYVWVLESRETTLGLKVAFNVGRPGLKFRDVVRVRILLHTYKLKKKKSTRVSLLLLADILTSQGS